MSHRVIALVDMDCFYVQVEQRLNPALKGKPCAVVQYRTYKGGGIIAVGYEARARGIKRGMMGDEAKLVCPEIELARVPEVRGKSDLTKYREAGAEVIMVFRQFSDCVERASIDEAYIDLTNVVEQRLSALDVAEVSSLVHDLPNTYITGWDGHDGAESDDNSQPEDSISLEGKDGQDGLKHWLSTVFDVSSMAMSDQYLAVAGVVVEEMRAEVFKQTGFRCSAGIAHNKTLAKLACGLHKPNKQTILPSDSVSELFKTLPVNKVRNLGGKLGIALMEQLSVEMMGGLCDIPMTTLQRCFGDKTGCWLYDICRGVDHEPVTDRYLPRSVGCSKNFRGPEALVTKNMVHEWLSHFASEVIERLTKDRQQNHRLATTLTVNVSYISSPRSVSVSRSCALVRYSVEKLTTDAFALIQKLNTSPSEQQTWSPAVVMMGLSASKFVDDPLVSVPSIAQIFSKQEICSTLDPESQNMLSNNLPSSNARKLSSTPKHKKGIIQNYFSPSHMRVHNETDDHSDSLDDKENMNVDVKEVYRSTECAQVNMDHTSEECHPSTSDMCFEDCTRLVPSNARLAQVCEPESITQPTNNVSPIHSAIVHPKVITNKDDGVIAYIEGSVCVQNNELHSTINSSKLCLGKDDNAIEHSAVIPCDIDMDMLTCLPISIQFEAVYGLQIDGHDVDKILNELGLDGEQYRLHVNNSSSNDVGQAKITCEKCGQLVSSSDLTTHMDFHLATELDKQANFHSRFTSPVVSTGKRKLTDNRNSGKKVKKSKATPALSKIHTFFQKS